MSEFKNLLGEWIEDEGRKDGEIEPERLAAYLSGELSEGEAEDLRAQLAGNPEAAKALIDLEELGRPETAEADVLDFEVAAAWREFGGRLEGESSGGATTHAETPAEAPAPAAAPAVLRPPRRTWGIPHTLAAALATGVLGLSLWTAQLQQENAALRSGPALNVPIAYLDAPTRSSESLPTLELADDGYAVLILTPDDPTAFAEFSARIVDDAGVTVFEGQGLVPSDYGTLRLGITGEILRPGDYEVQLTGLRGGEGPEAGRFGLRVEAANVN